MSKVCIGYIYDTEKEEKNILMKTNLELEDSPKHISLLINTMAEFYGLTMHEFAQLIKDYCLDELDKRGKGKKKSTSKNASA